MARGRLLVGSLIVSSVLWTLPLSAVGQVCGNGSMEGDEQCDDGNTFGGEGCASNCTLESQQACQFAMTSNQTSHAGFFDVPYAITGRQTLTLGSARASDPTGEIPFVIRAADIRFLPSSVSTLGCSCLLAAPDPQFGPGNAAAGSFGCGAGGLSSVSYETEQDSNTHLNNPDTDPQCMNGTVEPGGACSSPPHFSYTSTGPTGSVVLQYSLSNYSLTGGCTAQCGFGGTSPAGADGIICTADDPAAVSAQPTRLVLTSGFAVGRVLHANGDATQIEKSAMGHVPNCAALGAGTSGALNGMATVSAMPELNKPSLGDVVVTMTLTCEAPTGELPTPVVCPPTATPVTPATSTPNPTATATPHPACVGDCNDDGVVLAEEASICQQVFVGGAVLSSCVACDADHSATVTAAEVTLAQQNAARGCPGFPTFTPTPTPHAAIPTSTVTPPPVATETATAAVPTLSPTASRPSCPADCNRNAEVTIDELIRAVNIALGTQSVDSCIAADTSGNGEVTVDEIIRGVNAALNGCPT